MIFYLLVIPDPTCKKSQQHDCPHELNKDNNNRHANVEEGKQGGFKPMQRTIEN